MPMRSFLKESSAHTLCAGDLEAVFLPDHGMLGASLRYKGVEILRRGKISKRRGKGEQRGNPLLYPWANRLSEPRYRVLGREVVLDNHRRFSISTSMGFRCTVCHGLCSAG